MKRLGMKSRLLIVPLLIIILSAAVLGSRDYRDEALRVTKEVEAFVAKWQPIIPEAVQCLLKDLADCLRFYDFPKQHWRSIRTNNYIERLFNAVKMRTRAMGAFRNEASCILVFYAVVRSMHFRKLSLPA